jgi:hypothetical protein
LVLDFAREVAAIRVVHDDAKLALFGFVDFNELYDVRVLEDL